MRRWLGLTLAIPYGLAIFLANWMILHVGVPAGSTHLLPVGFGLMAPSGTYVAALVLVLRDLLQRAAGRWVALLVILPGIALTALMNPHLALASGAAFACSETADFLVYTPLQRKTLVGAVLVSATVGNLVDSTIFLSLAGIPLALAWPGQVVGKLWAILLATAVIALLRRLAPVRQPVPTSPSP